jgi:hypothetical protein
MWNELIGWPEGSETMTDLLKELEGGDRRSIGRANEVVAQVLNDPSLFKVVFDGMLSHDPLVRMRCADAVEKITARHPEYLQPHKKKLIQQVAKIDQQEVRWHVAQMFPRLELSQEEQAVVVELLLDYVNDRSKIVKTFSMQALADFAERDAGLRTRVIKLLEELTRTGSPAMKSRGRKLLEKLKQYDATARSR